MSDSVASMSDHVPSVLSKSTRGKEAIVDPVDREDKEKENNQPFKKHRTAQLDDEESLGSDDEEDIEDDEYEHEVEEEDQEDPNQIALRANDVIELSFDGIGAAPTYTHQLFENEKLVFPVNEANTYTYENLADLMIKVDVSLKNDLTDKVSILCDSGAVIGEDMENNIRNQLSKANVGGPTTVISENNSSNSSSHVFPIGTKTYSFKLNGDDYEIYLATHRDQYASAIIKKCEKLAMWFIETADSVNFDDDKWEALFLFRKNISCNRDYTLAGYVTLYTFRNPFVGSKLRLCQALILPSVQRGGLGTRLLHEVYSIAAARDVVVEVSIEDPAPGFSVMRDSSDVAWFLAHHEDGISKNSDDDGGIRCVTKWFDQEMSKEPIDRVDPLVYPKDQVNIENMCSTLKLTKHQVIFVVEALQYAALCKSSNTKEILTDIGERREQLMKTFRLSVKRRLMNENKQVKSLQQEDKGAMQKLLADLYEEELHRFQAVHYCKIDFMRKNINSRRETPFVTGS